jgi:signal transduction histidine kinase
MSETATSVADRWRALAAIAGTRAFRQAALFVAVSAIAGALMMWQLLATTSDAVTRQVIETITVEADGLASLAETAGAVAAMKAIASRMPNHPDRIYLLETTVGTRLAGNLQLWPQVVPRGGAGNAVGGGTFDYAPDRNQPLRRVAGVGRSVNGLNLLVGRDLEPQRQLAGVVRLLYVGGFGALALAGLLAGLIASQRALGRVGEIARTSEGIMTGDLAARVPLTGSGDELDRLAGNLNAMLDRIESLMAGLREVSDNIAHDLKTPLTRLRGRAEAALREGNPQAVREGLGRVIEDSDDVIKTFNALLLIARLEAGALEASAATFDLGALVRDVGELYEPVAEEAGLRLECSANGEVLVHANRQLVGQAVANMLDNAIKYGTPSAAKPGEADISVGLDAAAGEVRIGVGDHGPGIPPADRARVLKRFVRLEASRTRPGTGLGLSLVAAVARLHGGRIELDDNGPGLRIVLVLSGKGVESR